MLLVSIVIVSCTEDIDTSSRYVFSDYTVSSYLEKHECYSQFVELTKLVPVSDISETSVYQLLSARGNYTVFAPTNEAIDSFLVELTQKGLINEPSWDAFTDSTKLDSIRKVVVHNSVIDCGNEISQRIYTSAFEQNGTTETSLPLANMKDRRLVYVFNKGVLTINNCLVDEFNRDIEVTNGLVNRIHGVISPKEIYAFDYFRDLVDANQATGYLMFSKALLACGIRDTLLAYEDEAYRALREAKEDLFRFDNYKQHGWSDMTGDDNSDGIAPDHRRFGFTMFAEKDSYWIEQGLDPTAPDALERLQDWIADKNKYPSNNTYTVDNNYTSEHNMLHQWLTYHVLPMKLLPDQLVYHCNELGYSKGHITLPCPEWYSVFGEPRLLKIYDSDKSKGIYLNSFAPRNNGRKDDGFEAPGCPDELRGVKILTGDSLTNIKDIVNACIYPLEEPLAYTEDVRRNLGKERIRLEGMSLLPEAATNYIRRHEGSKEDKFNHVYFPPNNVYQYFENMSIKSEDTKFIYFNGWGYDWPLFSQDEMKASGHYDIVFKLPPVPNTNTYEVRYKILATGARGVVQVYFGSDPDNLPVAGIPIDLRKDITYYLDPGVNWEDTGDEDKDSELDHNLRNHMMMKSGRHERSGSGTTRETSNNIRFIVARQTMYSNRTYYIRFKSVLDSDKTEFHLDYFELCPKDVYDNPSDPEDIW